MVYLRKNGEPAWENLAGVVLWERAFDVLALGLLGFTASIILGIHKTAIAAGIVTVVLSIIILIIQRIRSLPIIGNKAKSFSSMFVKTGNQKLYQLGCLCMCCLCWTYANLTIMGLLFNALHFCHSLPLAFAVTPPSIFAGMVPVSLWGVGTRDGALAYFLQGITSPEIAISAGFLYTALVYWLLGVIGTPFLLFAKRNLKEQPYPRLKISIVHRYLENRLNEDNYPLHHKWASDAVENFYGWEAQLLKTSKFKIPKKLDFFSTKLCLKDPQVLRSSSLHGGLQKKSDLIYSINGPLALAHLYPKKLLSWVFTTPPTSAGDLS